MPTATYLASPAPDSFSVVSLLAQPFWWSLNKVWGSSGVDLGEHADANEWKKRQGEYVVPDLVEVRRPVPRYMAQRCLLAATRL